MGLLTLPGSPQNATIVCYEQLAPLKGNAQRYLGGPPSRALESASRQPHLKLRASTEEYAILVAPMDVRFTKRILVFGRILLG